MVPVERGLAGPESSRILWCNDKSSSARVATQTGMSALTPFGAWFVETRGGVFSRAWPGAPTASSCGTPSTSRDAGKKRVITGKRGALRTADASRRVDRPDWPWRSVIHLAHSLDSCRNREVGSQARSWSRYRSDSGAARMPRCRWCSHAEASVTRRPSGSATAVTVATRPVPRCRKFAAPPVRTDCSSG